MKRLLFICFAILLAIFSACNFSEELTIDANGTGRLSIKFDGSQLLQMGGGVKADSKSPGRVVDSVISFRKLLANKKDSIALLPSDEQERLKKMEPFNLHMVMNEEAGDMKIDMYTDFNEVSELSDAFSAFQNASAFGNKDMGVQKRKTSLSVADATEMKYTFNGSLFSRTNTVVDYDLLQQNTDSLGNVELFLESSTYTLIYHFPRPVKSVTNKGALYSEDRKTITLKVPFMEYLKDPEILNIEVELDN